MHIAPKSLNLNGGHWGTRLLWDGPHTAGKGCGVIPASIAEPRKSGTQGCFPLTLGPDTVGRRRTQTKHELPRAASSDPKEVSTLPPLISLCLRPTSAGQLHIELEFGDLGHGGAAHRLYGIGSAFVSLTLFLIYDTRVMKAPISGACDKA